MAQTLKRVVERAGLDPTKLTPHTLRHTGISLVLMNCADLKTAQDHQRAQDHGPAHAPRSRIRAARQQRRGRAEQGNS
jgi:integrase